MHPFGVSHTCRVPPHSHRTCVVTTPFLPILVTHTRALPSSDDQIKEEEKAAAASRAKKKSKGGGRGEAAELPWRPIKSVWAAARPGAEGGLTPWYPRNARVVGGTLEERGLVLVSIDEHGAMLDRLSTHFLLTNIRRRAGGGGASALDVQRKMNELRKIEVRLIHSFSYSSPRGPHATLALLPRPLAHMPHTSPFSPVSIRPL